jgi:hypothetical protein
MVYMCALRQSVVLQRLTQFPQKVKLLYHWLNYMDPSNGGGSCLSELQHFFFCYPSISIWKQLVWYCKTGLSELKSKKKLYQ